MLEYTLSSFAALQSGQVLSRKEAQPGGSGQNYRRLTLRAIRADGAIDLRESESFLAKEVLSPDQLTCENDIVIRMFSPIYPAVVTPMAVGLFVPAQLGIIRITKKSLVLPDYLSWYLALPKVGEALLAMSGGRAQRAIKIAALADIAIPIPSLEKQKTIIQIDKAAKRCSRLHTELAEQQLVFSQTITTGMIGGQ